MCKLVWFHGRFGGHVSGTGCASVARLMRLLRRPGREIQWSPEDRNIPDESRGCLPETPALKNPVGQRLPAVNSREVSS